MDVKERWSELCLDEGVEWIILERIKRRGLSEQLCGLVRREVENPEVQEQHVERAIYTSFSALGLDIQLKNAVYKELMSLLHVGTPRPLPIPHEHLKEPLGFVRQAQEEWEGKLRRGVNTLCTELGVPLSRERTQQEREAVRRKWHSLGAETPDQPGLHPIYSPKDFLEVVTRVRNSNYCPHVTVGGESCERLMKVQLSCKSILELRQHFSALHPSRTQVDSTAPESDYHEKACKVLRVGLQPLARQMCKTGCPVSLRKVLWCRALGVSSEHQENAFHFEQLKSSVLTYALLFERLIIKDVKRTAANDDDYFVFEDVMCQVLLALLHDSSLLPSYQHLSISPFTAYVKGNVGVEDCEVVYPPSGVVPFHGFSLYVAPLCYFYERPDHLYALFKEMYLRYFVRLHCLSSNEQGILSLCCLFESLLESRQPELFQYLRKIGADPLRLVFAWIMVAFAGYLDSRELLLLWDRIVGFDSLELVPILAVGLLEFRAANLFKATSLSEAEAVLADLSCLKVLPLLQQTLFL